MAETRGSVGAGTLSSSTRDLRGGIYPARCDSVGLGSTRAHITGGKLAKRADPRGRDQIGFADVLLLNKTTW